MSQQWRSGFPDYTAHIWRDFATRIVIITGFIITEDVAPFWRQIQQEEVWLYRYPNTVGYVTTTMLYIIAISIVITVIAVFFILNRNIRESYEALLVPSLSIPLCGLLTNFIKISVGRPRPDYYARCLPGVLTIDVNAPCTGDMDKVLEGRKSFPSGHSGISFCAFGFVSLYVAGKLCTFNARGRGTTWRLLLPMIPLTCALMIAISRTCDYHHHWQDVTVGSIFGLFISTLVYRQYYPSLGSTFSPIPFAMLDKKDEPVSTQHPNGLQFVKIV